MCCYVQTQDYYYYYWSYFGLEITSKLYTHIIKTHPAPFVLWTWNNISNCVIPCENKYTSAYF